MSSFARGRPGRPFLPRHGISAPGAELLLEPIAWPEELQKPGQAGRGLRHCFLDETRLFVGGDGWGAQLCRSVQDDSGDGRCDSAR